MDIDYVPLIDQRNHNTLYFHKEDGLSRRRFVADERRRVANELSKHFHPLEGQGEDNVLYNIVNGNFAPPAVNVADAVSIGDKMLKMTRQKKTHSKYYNILIEI